jgi:hypothetical protein
MSVSEEVRDFVIELYTFVRLDPNPIEVARLYDDFKSITESLFKDSPWPDAKLIEDKCQGDEVLILFYK